MYYWKKLSTYRIFCVWTVQQSALSSAEASTPLHGGNLPWDLQLFHMKICVNINDHNLNLHLGELVLQHSATFAMVLGVLVTCGHVIQGANENDKDT